MLQGYCYSTPLARLADHPLEHFVHFETEWHFCSWLTEVKEANYWALFFHRAAAVGFNCRQIWPFTTSRMLWWQFIFIELCGRKQNLSDSCYEYALEFIRKGRFFNVLVVPKIAFKKTMCCVRYMSVHILKQLFVYGIPTLKVSVYKHICKLHGSLPFSFR